jgi:hypothetical protein
MVVVVTAAVAVVVVRHGEDGGADITSAPEGPGTGWFLPPERWSVTSVFTDQLEIGMDGPCPCTSWVAVRPGADAAAIVLHVTGAQDANGTDDTDGTEGTIQDDDPGTDPIDVGGRPGWVRQVGPGALLLDSISEGRQVTLEAQAVDAAALATLADAALDQLDAGETLAVEDLPLPDGFVGALPAVTPAWQGAHLVVVTATDADSGRRLSYQMGPAGLLASQILTARDLRADGAVITGILPDDDGNPQLVAFGGPDDLIVGGPPLSKDAGGPVAGPVDSFTDDELHEIAGGLREATTSEWRDALASAAADGQVDELVLQADAITAAPVVEP